MATLALRQPARPSASRLFAPGLWRVAVATAALVIVSICGFNSLHTVGRTFPGFFVWENLFVPAIGASTWSGVASGLPYHSWLESADGKPLRDAKDLQSVLEGKRAGDVVRYVASKDGRMRTFDVPVET